VPELIRDQDDTGSPGGERFDGRSDGVSGGEGATGEAGRRRLVRGHPAGKAIGADQRRCAHDHLSAVEATANEPARSTGVARPARARQGWPARAVAAVCSPG
jgi:hypothetical protein